MRARVRLELTGRDGEVVAVREARNSVMRDGALLVARLFAGAEGAAGITHMGVGTSDVPETGTYTTAALSNDESAPLTGGTDGPIPAEAFTITPDPDRRVALVRVRGTLGDTVAVGTVREAGLLSRAGDTTTLYNRVTFAPLTKGGDHELTLFWEITFPYGDLHGLA
ncbi:MAG TPA: hypothetical protein VF519_00130 [Mycobacteriales bacterium]